MNVIGLDNDGSVICYDPEYDTDPVYNCGETLEEFGIDSLFPQERVTLALEGILRIGRLNW
jgi:hypothetical protein